ncbi:MAG TPA: hypothetical protein VMT10_04115 [Solirubrobacteraceae bacterium]|nr:hypothetical protein [Solirubrobacteraceae bacterium]
MNYVLAMMALVFVVNLMPAFGPPSWIILVYFRLRHDVPIVPLVVGGAAASAAGRFVLANACRRLGGHLPEGKRADLEAIGTTLTDARGTRWGLIALFVVSPLSSAQLFEAAGLTPQVRLAPVSIAFFCGRLVTYSIYVTGASLAKSSLTALLRKGVRSPAAIATQVVLLAMLAAFLLIPWARILGGRGKGGRPGSE